ncbi:MAG: heme biosynthesis protein HemY [Polaromonas sp.]|nr:heme biosynthesis protein HemY [Polaromonas sp.]
MRAAIWFLALFGVAVATALVAGNNQAVVTVFWPPHRIDLSFNLMVLLLAGLFLLVYLATRALTAGFSLPLEARRWRAQQKERAMYGALMDSLAHLMAGRFIRATRSAEVALAQEKSLTALTHPSAQSLIGLHAGRAEQLRALAHVLVAESAQSLQNKPLRDANLQLALNSPGARYAHEVREGVQFRAARWALEDRDPSAALEWLAQLPQGAGRRTLALRIRLKAARQARQITVALETARLLAKHRAFSAGAAQSIVRGLALELLNDAHDPVQLQQTWQSLDDNERAIPELAVHAAARLVALQGDAALARVWLVPVWEDMIKPRSEMGDKLRMKLVGVMESGFESLDAAWLARIESAQTGSPRDANLQYLAGMACLSRQLWGKARQLLTQSVMSLQDTALRRNAWRALAVLAEQRGDESAAVQAYKQAAQS